jgi:pyruvate/2-oxoglutarate dehydrogenase complex dihydrolipoamide dehydrogenase (E3) component
MPAEQNLIYYARVASLARRGAEFGLEMDSLEISMEGVQRRKRTMVEEQHQIHVDLNAASGVELIMGEGSFIAPRTVDVALNDGGMRRPCGNRVFLALDSRVRRIYRCSRCGLVIHRDRNGALNVKGRAGLSGMVPVGESREPRISSYNAALGV